MVSASLGIVAIGRDEGQRLVRCMESLAATGAPLVYVDSASTDDSVAIAQAHGAQVVELDMSQQFTAARARNAGAAALFKSSPKVAYIQFIDGDCELAPEWIPQALDFFQRSPGVAVVCGRRRERYPERSVFNQLCDLEWDTPVGEAAACGGDSLMRAEPFRAVEGFDARLSAGEEPELCGRLRAAGWAIHRLPVEMTLHDAAMTRLGQWWMRAVRSGFGYAQVWRATRSTSTPLYRRELNSAAFWGGIVPGSLVATALAAPALVPAVALLPAAQLARIAARKGPRSALSWQYASLMMMSKLAEVQGIALFLRRGKRRTVSGPRYK